MTRLLLALCLLVFSVYSFAQTGNQQTGSIKGFILTSNNKPAADATVRLTGTKKATLTNNEGRFAFEHVQPAVTSLKYPLLAISPLKRR